MLKIEVKLDSADVLDAMNRLQNAMRDTSPLMGQLTQNMEEAAKRAFEGECDPVTGAKWPALNPDYKRERHAQGRTGPILQVEGGLISSLTQSYGHGYARVGANHPFAAIHCFGGVTRAHWIRPRNKKALAWRKGGKSYVRRAVMHPGSAHQFFVLHVQPKALVAQGLAPFFDRVPAALPGGGRAVNNEMCRQHSVRLRQTCCPCLPHGRRQRRSLPRRWGLGLPRVCALS